MNKIAILSFITLLPAIAGCSEREVYDALQKRGQVECQNLPQAQYEQCIEDYQQSYDAYRRSLEETRDKK